MNKQSTDKTTVLMMGNPNVGKSALFNRLTGANAVVSNYPGTTVDYTSGTLIEEHQIYEIIDVPGTYSLEPRDAAEVVAVRMLNEHRGATVMLVLDSTKIERGLYLALEVMEGGAPCIIALNMIDIAHDKGISVDAPELQRLLGVPVIPTTAVSGEGVKQLADMVRGAQVADVSAISRRLKRQEAGAGCTDQMRLSPEKRWDLIDAITRQTVSTGTYRRSIGDVLGELTVKPATGIPVALAVLYAFWSIFGSFAGALVTDGFMVKFFDSHWLPWMQAMWPDPGSILYYIFVGDPLADNCFEAFGMLTSGLFVAIGVVLPAVLIFYLMMTLLEDSGYLPRLAVLMDTVLHRIGLHGYAIVPAILGLGCNVPAVTATRILETRKQRFIMMALLSIFIPCGAQLGVMLEVIPETVGWVMLYLILGFGIFGFVLDRIIPGENPEILIDVPPYHWPVRDNVVKKILNRTKAFLKDAVPFVLFGVFLINVLYLAGVIGLLADFFEPLFVTWFGVPKETVGPLIAAFLRKDLAVAQLSTIAMTQYQMISSVVLISIYFPCVATFVVMLREGWKELVAAVAVLITVVFFYGGLIHAIGILMGVA